MILIRINKIERKRLKKIIIKPAIVLYFDFDKIYFNIIN